MNRKTFVLITLLLLGIPALAADNLPAATHSNSATSEALWLGELPAGLAICGTVDWMPEIGVLLDYLVKERGLDDADQLMSKTLTLTLPSLDKRLTLDLLSGANGRTFWIARWEGKPRPDFHVDDMQLHPRTDLVSRVHYTLANACTLLREHEPTAKEFKRHRGIADNFEEAFLQALHDPSAEYGWDPISLSVEGRSLTAPSESFSAHWMDKQMGIARVYLPDLFFSRDSHFDEGIKALQSAAPVKTLILDLRDSAGGSMKDLHAMIGRFLPQDIPIYETFNRRGSSGTVQLKSSTVPDNVLDIPILVLVSGKTRGGAEILAGVLQATGRAKVFGEPTAGLATHKSIVTLSKKRALLLTHEVLAFPGKSQPQIRIQPDIAAPADKSLDAALATLAVNGKNPENPFIRKDEKVSPLIRAILAEQQDEAVRLIETGAELDVEASVDAMDDLLPRKRQMERDGRTPLVGYPLAIASAAVGMPKVLQAIGQRDPQRLHATDINGRTALAYAARSGFLASTRYLLDQGLDPIKRADKYPTSNTPLALAVQEKRSEAVALLVAAIPKEKYAGVEVAEQVWLAASFNDLPTLRVLLEAGVPPGYIAPQGNTALISAVLDGNLERVQLILKHSATVDGHRYRGRNIFEIAEANLSKEIEDAQEIHRLIQAAPRTVSRWEKPADVQRFETLLKIIEGKNR